MSNLSNIPSTSNQESAAGNGAAELLQAMLLELKGIRLALVALVTEGGKILPDDLDPQKQDFSHLGNTNL